MLYSKLFAEQKKAVRFVLRNEGTCLFFDQGTGKTWVALSVIEEESLDVSNYQAIVVCLKTNKHTTWEAKAKELIPSVNVATDLDTFLKLPFPRALFIHYDAASPKKMRTKLARIAWTFAAFDEAQRLKKRSSASSMLARMLRDVPRRVIMTGTPTDKANTDLWAQLRFANYKLLGSKGVDRYGKPLWLGDNWKAFFKGYLKKAGFMGYGHKFRTKLLEERFLDKIAKITLRVDRSILGLKGSSMKRIKFKLGRLQQMFYDRLEKDLVVEFGENGIVSTPMKATLQIKLAQITGGHIKDDDGETHIVGRTKLRELRDLLETFPPKQQIVVFFLFREEGNEIMRLLERMYHRTAMIDGRVKDTKTKRARTAVIDAFQAGKLDAIAVQQRTGGVGVDLFAASKAVFYSASHSYIDFEQAKSRLERHGQKEFVEFYYLMAENTVDEDRYDAVVSKRRLNEVTFQRLKRMNTMALKPNKAKKNTDEAADKTSKVTSKEKAAKAAKTETKATDKNPEYKYGVADLQKLLGHGDPATTRVALRNNGIEKAGKSYGWNARADLEEVVAKIKAGKKPAAKKDDAKADKKADAKTDKKAAKKSKD